jgi:hypothetical protein
MTVDFGAIDPKKADGQLKPADLVIANHLLAS